MRPIAPAELVIGRPSSLVWPALSARSTRHTQSAGSHNIRAYSAIAERGWVEQISGFGWRTRILGPARREGRNLLAALRIEIDADTPRQLRDAGLRPDALLAAGQAREAA